jgi:hypothetical protein
MMNVTSPALAFPVNWSPYPFQVPLWKYLKGGGRTAVCVWHRRAGKDIMGINWITACALQEVGVYWYLFPTADQAKTSVFESITLDGRTYLDFIPKAVIKRILVSTMKIELTNGSVIQFHGASNPKALRGAGIKGCIFSEFSFMKVQAIESVVQPMLVRSKGWALYLYTPSDKPEDTHGEALYHTALEDKDAFAQLKTIHDTTDHYGNPLVTEKDLIHLRSRGFTEDRIRREFFCDFNAVRFHRSKDAMFIEEMEKAESAGRFTHVHYNPSYTVHTAWDIGIADYTAIWFYQVIGSEVYVIDLVYNRNKNFEYYLDRLIQRPYVYERMIAPHDMIRRNHLTMDTRLYEMNLLCEKHKLPPFLLGRKYLREQMVGKTREFFGKCYIDLTRCIHGIDALYSEGAGKEKRKHPENDLVDAFMYMVMDVEEQRLLQDLEDKRSNYQRLHQPEKTISDYKVFNYQMRGYH